MNTDMVISMFFKSKIRSETFSLRKDFKLCLFAFRSEINVKSITATLVVWLQNENGFNMYKPSDAAVDAFLESYRPGRDKTEAPVTESTITTNNNTEIAKVSVI